MSLRAAAATSADGIHGSPAFFGSRTAAVTAAAVSFDAGISLSARSASSRTVASGSATDFAARIAAAPSAVRGITARAARRTPGSALARAAFAASNASPFADANAPRPCIVQSAWNAPAALLPSFTTAASCGTTSVLPRSTSSRWAVMRCHMFSCESVATSSFSSAFVKSTLGEGLAPL